MTMPLNVLMAEMAVAPPCSEARAMSAIDVMLGRELCDDRAVETIRYTAQDALNVGRTRADLHAAGLEVWAGDVDLKTRDAGLAVQALGEAVIFFDSKPADADDDGRIIFRVLRQDLFQEMLDAARRDADGVEHSGGGFCGAGAGFPARAP